MNIAQTIFLLSIFFVSTIANENEIKIDYLVTLKECKKRTKTGDHVTIQLRSSFTNGTVIQNSGTNSFELGTNKVIKCYGQGLQDMCAGEKRQLTCPPHLAYGVKGTKIIPSETTIIFEVELLGISPDIEVKNLVVKEQCDQRSKKEDYLSVFYRGRFDNGTEFETNVGKDSWKFFLGLERAIKCYDRGLIDMCVGEKRELTCPPHLAYGEEGTSKIPANSTLIFEVELVMISPDLQVKNLVVKENCEKRAKNDDILYVFYRGRFENGTEFETNVGKDPFKFTLGSGGVIKCYDRAVINMCVGEKRELTCPPHLAYGERGTENIPGNSTLTFEVELIKIHDYLLENTVIRKMEKCLRKTKKGDLLKIHYKYGSPQQEMVYSTYQKNEPLEFILGAGEHWKAFDFGLEDMCIGEIRKLVYEISHTGNITTEVLLMGIKSPKVYPVYLKTEL